MNIYLAFVLYCSNIDINIFNIDDHFNKFVKENYYINYNKEDVVGFFNYVNISYNLINNKGIYFLNKATTQTFNFNDVYQQYNEFVLINNQYQDVLRIEQEREVQNTNEVLSKVKELVGYEYFKSINEFLNDEENGIWGGLKIVETPIGDWQDEEGDYWDILKGMYVNQSCGYSGDDYNGTLTIKLNNNMYLSANFSL